MSASFTWNRESQVYDKLCNECCWFLVEEWNAATSVAKALKIGKFESEATFNLQTRVAKPVVEKMKEAVAMRGLGKLVTHELLAKDLLNQNFSSGLGQVAAWQEECRNQPDNRLATRPIG